ncbi:hypothetical protein [Leifsonia aquatica]|uniref:hypothetical protein n=1 Tax=Leifsonia aquatica TaxID=144185 RepID=UPI003818F97C
MAHTITFPDEREGVFGGVEFIEGVGQADLGPNLIEYFTLRGARVTDRDAATPTLEDLNLDQLRAAAVAAGVDVDPKWKRKKLLIDAIHEKVAADAETAPTEPAPEA